MVIEYGPRSYYKSIGWTTWRHMQSMMLKVPTTCNKSSNRSGVIESEADGSRGKSDISENTTRESETWKSETWNAYNSGSSRGGRDYLIAMAKFCHMARPEDECLGLRGRASHEVGRAWSREGLEALALTMRDPESGRVMGTRRGSKEMERWRILEDSEVAESRRCLGESRGVRRDLITLQHASKGAGCKVPMLIDKEREKASLCLGRCLSYGETPAKADLVG
ncbi:hypothetical protein B0T18DRAFT_9120 [Schizothecium vesticola]|uniref:Uncharacterized protein n=1 Tax=Schizothecium vesticola TaxID=314040 RepID=A0AA40KBU1_9PEZI|nr:hypothetical protein B0T18DRAFT_9120 [Schizothecium vesticola]